MDGGKLRPDAPHQELSGDERQKLNELAERVDLVAPYFCTAELAKWNFTMVLCDYYQHAAYREVNPPDGAGDPLGLGTAWYVSAKKASTLLKSILGADIPNIRADYQDNGYGDTICKNGVYYLFENDWEHPVFNLAAYESLGDDMFYLSFDVDDRGLAGPANEMRGVVRDGCRLVVKRSASPWGFTVLMKFKDRYESILPDDFAPPRHVLTAP